MGRMAGVTDKISEISFFFKDLVLSFLDVIDPVEVSDEDMQRFYAEMGLGLKCRLVMDDLERCVPFSKMVTILKEAKHTMKQNIE